MEAVLGSIIRWNSKRSMLFTVTDIDIVGGHRFYMGKRINKKTLQPITMIHGICDQTGIDSGKYTIVTK